MGTKNDPGKFDCYANALPDEPIFTLLARDPDFYRLVMLWAEKRRQDVLCGERPDSDLEAVREAEVSAEVGRAWRHDNKGIWRQRSTP